MAHFEQRYAQGKLGRAMKVIAIAAAHHRLNFIHPFPDGNGRVSRLMSHAMALDAGIGAHGLWSVSRGLARGLESRSEYRRMMDHADSPRQGDLDGRGNLSLRALLDFIEWFLRVCLDQVRFMGGLFEFQSLTDRLGGYVQARGWRPESRLLLEEAVLRGEVARGDAGRLLGMGERAARAVLSTLVADGILASDTPKGPVSLRFPVQSVEILFPRLFPET
jgi:Fic family protein